MKKLKNILCVILICVCSFFTFSACGPNPNEGNPEAMGAALDNFNGIKAIYIAEEPTENEKQANLNLLQSFSNDILTNLAQDALSGYLDGVTNDEILTNGGELWGWSVATPTLAQVPQENQADDSEEYVSSAQAIVESYANTYKNNLTAQIVNIISSPTPQLSVSGSITNETLLAVLNFEYFGLTNEDLTEIIIFLNNQFNSYSGVSNVVNSSKISVLESVFGVGQTSFLNIRIQNYSMEFLKPILLAETNENPFPLPARKYVSLVYMTKGEFDLGDNEIVSSGITFSFGFYYVSKQVGATLNFKPKDAVNFSAQLNYENEEIGQYVYLNGAANGGLSLNTAFTNENDETSGGTSPTLTDMSDAVAVSFASFENNTATFNTSMINVLQKNAEGLWYYVSSTHDVCQIIFNNASEEPFTIAGLASLLFQKV